MLKRYRSWLMAQYLILTASMLPKDSDSKPRSRELVMKRSETVSWLSLLKSMPMSETNWLLNKRRRIRISKISWLVDVPAKIRLSRTSVCKSKASFKSVSSSLLQILVTIRTKRVT